MGWETILLLSAIGIAAGGVTWGLLGRRRDRFNAGRASDRLRRMKPGEKTTDPAFTSSWDIRYSRLPMLRRLITFLSIGPRVLLFLEQSGSTMNVGTYLLLHAFCFAIAGLAAWWAHLPLSVSTLAAGAAGLAPLAVMALRRLKRFSKIKEQLPNAIRLIASAVRAGLSMNAGLGIAESELSEPIKGELRKLLNEWKLSADMDAALRHMAKRVPIADVRIFTACVCLHREVGGNFAQLLDQLAKTIQERFYLSRELKTLTAEGRLTGLILGVFPLLVAGLLYALHPTYFQPLFTHPIGPTLLWAFAGLEGVGFWMIQRLTTPRLS